MTTTYSLLRTIDPVELQPLEASYFSLNLLRDLVHEASIMPPSIHLEAHLRTRMLIVATVLTHHDTPANGGIMPMLAPETLDTIARLTAIAVDKAAPRARARFNQKSDAPSL